MEIVDMTVAAHERRTPIGSLLIVDDDRPLLQRLAQAMKVRNFDVSTAESVEDALTQVQRDPPDFAVVDMRVGSGNGMEVISALKAQCPGCRAIVLTGYGNIATAVNAVKIGAALLAPEGRSAEPPLNPMSADRIRWEHINRIYGLCERNVSETARRLRMHRRTLQRILAKHAPR
jgi:two-component system, response regulator RegA